MAPRVHNPSLGRRALWGGLTMTAGAAICLLINLYNYFGPYNGINGSIGVLIVLCSTAAMLLPCAALAFLPWPRGLRILTELWLFADIVGTFVGCWFLEMRVEMGFLSITAIGWLLFMFARRIPRAGRPEATPA